jgi:hypothetical protein
VEVVVLKRIVLKHLAETRDVNRAFRQASDEIYASVQERVVAGDSLEHTLASIGIEHPADVMKQIGELGGWHIENFVVILTGGILFNIPLPACIEAQLKNFPKPTKEQIQEAYEACRKELPVIKTMSN